MNGHMEANYKQMPSSTVDVIVDICDYAYPLTVDGCWKRLDYLLKVGRITQTVYDEIKNGVTSFEWVDDE